jgi:hypothetical protein
VDNDTPPTIPAAGRPTVLAIDPGGKETGLAAITVAGAADPELLAAAVLDRGAPCSAAHGYELDAWAEANVAAVARLLVELDHRPTASARRQLDDVLAGHLPHGITLAIENVRSPNPHRRRADGNALTNPDGILATAWVAGAIAARWPGIVIVEPAAHGQGPPAAYPPAITYKVNLKRKGPPADRLRHARAAYDVARAARWALPRFHPEAQRAARIIEPTLYRAAVTATR